MAERKKYTVQWDMPDGCPLVMEGKDKLVEMPPDYLENYNNQNVEVLNNRGRILAEFWL